MATTRTGSGFVCSLERALMEDAREEIEAVIKVGVLLAAGRPQSLVEGRLGLTRKQVRDAVIRLRRVAPERATS